MIRKNGAIGIFDSGVGGLTVAQRVRKELPGEKIIYFGDTARAPYGVHTKERITAQSMQIMRFMTTHELKLVIIACNTICVSCYDELSAACDAPVIEIVTPAAEDCVTGLPEGKGRVGIIATQATVKSEGYVKAIRKLSDGVEVFQKACPNLVTMAEQGIAGSAAAALMCEMYLRELKERELDALILGCTHFPLFAGQIRDYMEQGVSFTDPAEASVRKARKMLEEAGAMTLASGENKPEHEFYVSGDTEAFSRVAENLLGERVLAKRIDIEKY